MIHSSKEESDWSDRWMTGGLPDSILSVYSASSSNCLTRISIKPSYHKALRQSIKRTSQIRSLLNCLGIWSTIDHKVLGFPSSGFSAIPVRRHNTWPNPWGLVARSHRSDPIVVHIANLALKLTQMILFRFKNRITVVHSKILVSSRFGGRVWSLHDLYRKGVTRINKKTTWIVMYQTLETAKLPVY